MIPKQAMPDFKRHRLRTSAMPKQGAIRALCFIANPCYTVTSVRVSTRMVRIAEP